MPRQASIDHLLAELREGMAADWVRLEERIERLKRRDVSAAELERVARAVAASRDRARRRAAAVLRIEYPSELPVSQRRATRMSLRRRSGRSSVTRCALPITRAPARTSSS